MLTWPIQRKGIHFARHEDSECTSCGCHQMQNCSCTSSDVCEAIKEREYRQSCTEKCESFSLEELFEKIKAK